MSRISDLLSGAESCFVHSESPKLDAELLLSEVLGQDPTWLKTWPEKEVSADQIQQFSTLVDRRAKGEPIAHILGRRGFWTLELLCDDSTLIPRPDTETLVEAALDLDLPEAASAIDLGTGTGAIALALASERPQWTISALDRSEKAIELAQRNAQCVAIDSVEFMVSNWFDLIALENKFDLIVANPPYIDPKDPHLDRGDVRFEPRSALVAEQSGYQDLFHIIKTGRDKLNDNGWLLLEHGFDQGDNVAAFMSKLGFKDIVQKRDLGGHIRVTGGTI